MLAIRLRVRPWSARCSPLSVGRSTVSVPSDWVTFMSELIASLSSPFGPFTETTPGLTSIVTPSGTAMGFLPIRLMTSPTAHSPHVSDDFPADASLLRLVAGHDAGRRGQDRGPHPSQHARDLLMRDVASPAGARDPAQAGDHGAPAVRVLQLDADHVAD